MKDNKTKDFRLCLSNKVYTCENAPEITKLENWGKQNDQICARIMKIKSWKEFFAKVTHTDSDSLSS